MPAARALPPRPRLLGTLLVVAVLATALSSALPAAANPAADGGTPTPAGVTRPDGGTPMPATATVNRRVAEVLQSHPGSRRISVTSVLLKPGVVMTVPGQVEAGATMIVPAQGGGQMTVSAANSSCPSGWLCMWENIYRNAGNDGRGRLAFYYCLREYLGDYILRGSNDWRDDVSSIWNNQTGGAVSYFHDWKNFGYRLVGSLRAPNYLQDLTRDRAADGGNWNDRIDRVLVC